MKSLTWATLAALAVAAATGAVAGPAWQPQAVVIVGRVVSARDTSAVAGAWVGFEDTKFQTATNESGYFRLRALLHEGVQVFRVRYIGFRTASRSLTVPGPDTVRLGLVFLEEGPFEFFNDPVVRGEPCSTTRHAPLGPKGKPLPPSGRDSL